MKETEQLRHQQTLAEKKAQEERRGALLDFASEFERSVASAVDVLAEEVRKVSIASAELSKNAKDSAGRSEEHTSELQSLMRISYAVFCLKKQNTSNHNTDGHN